MSKISQKNKDAMKASHAFFRNALGVIKFHCCGEQGLVCS